MAKAKAVVKVARKPTPTPQQPAQQTAEAKIFFRYFDPEFYASQLPEALRATNLAEHYLVHGWKLGLDPSAGFSTNDYLSLNPDVRSAGMNPLEHYARFGHSEGRHAKKPQSTAGQHRSGGNKPNVEWSYEMNINTGDRALLESSVLFDPNYMRATYDDLRGLSDSLLIDHFLYSGWKERRNPSAYFDVTHYLDQVPNLLAADQHPVLHYLRHGEGQGLSAVPWFWAGWYNETYQPAGGSPSLLEHYITTGRSHHFNPNPFFDARYYLQTNPDLAANGVDPWLHYLMSGYREKRKPSPLFNADDYLTRRQATADENPLVRFLRNNDNLRHRASRLLPPTASELYDEFQRHALKSDRHETLDPKLLDNRRKRAKPIAFYLPQFHPIAQNDEAWGKGFTEWRNTSKAMPRFRGHFQPRIPEELGHYSLNDATVFPRQIAMAKAAGLFGFCFYYYWFNGARALEKPINAYLGNPACDFPFAIMWANENWTRRWDGLDDEIIFRQDYLESDEEALLADLHRHFRDPRYIRVEGRPLFILYRPNLVPDTRTTIGRWRRILKDVHGDDPMIMMVQGFGDHDPSDYGLDGAIEFPPHHIGNGLEPINNDLDFLDVDFAGNIIPYSGLVNNSAQVKLPSYPLIRGVIPSWDNEARRGRNCTVYHGSTPEIYEDWLRQISKFAAANPVGGEPLVFINAWNEWAEAAYLEPDVYYGAAYLNATARALTHNKQRKEKLKILLVGHDAYPHGAQFIALNIVEYLVGKFAAEVTVLLLTGGPLTERYEALATTIVADRQGADLDTIIGSLAASGYGVAITNTVVSGKVVPALHKHGLRILSLIHELPRLIADYKLEPEALAIANHSERVIFPAPEVQAGFAQVVGGLRPSQAVVSPQGCYHLWKSDTKARLAIRHQLGLKPDDKLVLNVGYADWRKGYDIFASVAKLMCKSRSDVHFAWLGNLSPDIRNWLAADISDDAQLSGRFHFLDFTDNVGPVYEASDLFFLSSREDPYPTVLQEALQAGLPLVGFTSSGGGQTLIAKHGLLVDRSDLAAISAAIGKLIDLPEKEKSRLAEIRKAEIRENYDYGRYVERLLDMAEPGLKKVSVVVPNYNYANFLDDRLDSIFNQTYPLAEILVLDDVSTDNSLDVLEAHRTGRKRKFSIIPNERNSGSGYMQWAKGARLAQGEYIWIAEADDLAAPEFLDRAINVLDNSDAAFVFTDARQIDENSKLVAENYQYYYGGFSGVDFGHDFIMDGKDFVTKVLAIKNVVMNVSGVVWRRETLLKVLEWAEPDLKVLKVACDWKMYISAALRLGSVGFISSPLNVHRRHSSSVTLSRNAKAHFNELASVQDWVSAEIKLPRDTVEKRDRYRTEVKAYLGLSAKKKK